MTRRVVSDFADNPIPAKAIRLEDAYKIVLQALIVKPQIFSTVAENWSVHLNKSEEQDDPEAYVLLAELDGISFEERKRITRRSREANVFLREHLLEGAIIAHVRDPEAGEILQLSPEGWGGPFVEPPSRPFGEWSN